MEENFLKDLFNQKRYEEVIELLQSLYCGLYEEMLRFKNVEYDENNIEYTHLTALVRESYPQFIDNFILLHAVSANPENTYLDYINALLSTYMFFKKEYQTPIDESKYNDDDLEFVEED